MSVKPKAVRRGGVVTLTMTRLQAEVLLTGFLRDANGRMFDREERMAFAEPLLAEVILK